MTTTAAVPSPVRTVDGVELPPPGTCDLDASHTHVGFSVRHLMLSRTRGGFRRFRAAS